MYGAELVLRKLKEMGHKLIVVSARGYLDDKELQITRERIEELNLPIDNYEIQAFDKVSVCKKHNIDIAISFRN